MLFYVYVGVGCVCLVCSCVCVSVHRMYVLRGDPADDPYKAFNDAAANVFRRTKVVESKAFFEVVVVLTFISR